MSRRPRIVLNITLDYLAFPSFNTLIKNLSDIDFYVLNIIENKARITRDPIRYPEYNNLKEQVTMKLAPAYPRASGIISKLIRFPKNLRRYRLLTKQVHQQLDDIEPDLILATSDKGFGDRITQIWTKRHNIRYIILQPSFIDGSLQIPQRSWKESIIYKSKYILLNKILRVPIYRKNELYGYENDNNLVLLWSEHFLLGPETQNIRYTGLPAFDDLFINFDPERNLKHTILISSEIFEEIFSTQLSNKIHRIYNEIIGQKTDYRFIIKAHPRESIQKIKDKYSEYTDRVEIVSEMSIYTLFPQVDLLISVNSFSAVEAAAFGIPILNIIPVEARQLIKGYFDYQLAQIASTSDEAIQIIEEVYTDEYWKLFLQRRKQYFDDYFLTTDGSSTKRVKQILYDELGKSFET